MVFRTNSCHLRLRAVAAAAIVIMGANVLRAEEQWRNLYLDALPILDVRYRFEYVDQDTAARDAHAHTVRTRAGLETGRFHGMGAGFDVEWVEAIGAEKFNDTINGNVEYPVVPDPDDLQLNQLYLLSENTISDVSFKVGRQRIIWDNSRFIGNVGFRQNEQTFDAFRTTLTPAPKTALEYTYLDKVHRLFGTDSPNGEFGMTSHGVRAQFQPRDALTVTPFFLLLDYDLGAQAGLDSQSYGVRLAGGQRLSDDATLLYSGSLAYQSDYADNPEDLGLWYYAIEPGVRFSQATLKAGLETLEGDGRSAFQTPLATLHKFNGVTDQFLTTPPNGLQDLYLSFNFAAPERDWLSNLSFEAGYHEFWEESGDTHYGSEWNLSVFKKIPLDGMALNLGLEYASYSADNFSSDTDKLWLTLQFQMNSKPLRSYWTVAQSEAN